MLSCPAAVAAAFKVKAAALKEIVLPHLTPEVRLGMLLVEALSPERMATAFHEHVARPYDGHIRERDSQFFMREDVGGGDPLIFALRASWRGMSADEHAQVWALLPQLCSISERYARVAG